MESAADDSPVDTGALTILEEVSGIPLTFREYDSVPEHSFVQEREVVSLFRNLRSSKSMDGLLEFSTRLADSRSSTDLSWYITNWLGCRSGEGSQDLLLGFPVDPKSNPVHRHAVQYLADVGLLKPCLTPDASPKPYSSLRSPVVLSVSYCDSSHESVLSGGTYIIGKLQRIAFISMQERSSLRIGTVEHGYLKLGAVIICPMEHRGACSMINVIAGSFIAVVFGCATTPNYSRTRFTRGFINATLEARSTDFPSMKTSNRKSARGKSEAQLACPDCRRPLEVRKCSEADADSGTREGVSSTVVTYVCDLSDLKAAAETGVHLAKNFSRRIIFNATGRDLPSDLHSMWSDEILCRPVRRWDKKRGLQDYAVPEGFVTPTLFSRSTEGTISKETIYTIIRVVGHTELWGTPIWLMDPDGENGIEITPSERMYNSMILELRDWHHPCHRVRRSAISFIREWLDVLS